MLKVVLSLVLPSRLGILGKASIRLGGSNEVKLVQVLLVTP